ncbi:MAG: hypothetical protein ACP5OV_02730 [Acidimicrobiales bacterium]
MSTRIDEPAPPTSRREIRRADAELVAALRAELVARVRHLVATEHPLEGTVAIALAAGVGVRGVVPIGTAPLAQLRGSLVARLIPVVLAGIPLRDPFTQAVSAWRVASPAPVALAHLRALDAEERARLRADVAGHARTLARSLAELAVPAGARVGQRCVIPIVSTPVVLADTLDLVWSGPSGPHLLDVTTSPLGPEATALRSLHALTWTLRTGRVARTSASVSTATGEHVADDVRASTLAGALDAVVAQVATQLAGVEA